MEKSNKKDFESELKKLSKQIQGQKWLNVYLLWSK
jgi:hypothetical protein